MLLAKDELEELELTQKQFTSAIIRAQKQMEGWNFSIRKHLFEYDSVISKQRQRIYNKRDEILAAADSEDLAVKEKFVDDMKLEIKGFIADVVQKILLDYTSLEATPTDLQEMIRNEFSLHVDERQISNLKNLEELQEYLVTTVSAYFDEQVS